MILFHFIQIIVGVSFFVRTNRNLSFERVFKSNFVTKIGTFYLFYSLFALTLFHLKPLFLFFILNFPTVVLFLIKIGVLYKRKHCFQKEFLRLLNNILLQMRLGNGFRMAVFEASQSEESYFKEKMNEIMEVVAFSTQFKNENADLFVLRVVKEFKKIDVQPHLAVQRVCEFRNLLKDESDFRHRSGQVTRQIRIQQYVLSGFYLALLSFVIWEFGISEAAKYIFGSLTLFLLGIVMNYIWGRRLKWTV